jgi:hypothetical protein
MEETKKKAVERLRKEMKTDHDRGYERAYEMVADGTLDLEEAQKLVDAEEPVHEEFAEESRDYVEGFIDALAEMLKDAKSRSGEE